MKRNLLILVLLSVCCTSIKAQVADEGIIPSWTEDMKQAFSQEGRKNWKPEFTARAYTGFITGGYAFTGGVRIDGKRTFGLMVWPGSTFIDAAPANVYSLSGGLFMRRYFHLSKKDIVAFYLDTAVGAGYIYRIEGGYPRNPDTGETTETIGYREGEVMFAASLQPGIRIRFWKNLHLFLGPTYSTNTVGFHIGIGL